jgi:hypothetical protein
MDTMETSQFHNQGDIGIVVIVTPPRDINDNIAHANVFGVGAAIYRE